MFVSTTIAFLTLCDNTNNTHLMFTSHSRLCVVCVTLTHRVPTPYTYTHIITTLTLSLSTPKLDYNTQGCSVSCITLHEGPVLVPQQGGCPVGHYVTPCPSLSVSSPPF